ncbi:MAG: iron-sulfur cluster carrier protein ApbC [Gammaproteobacteria bacterium]|nr:iron-sulfur cluster carrier protein ApbC [Gammaproteobacteria bacterium]
MSQPENEKFSLPGVKHVITVASGKGGVGKSTVAANLALALLAEGHACGLLDADIYGPSVGIVMGVAEDTKPEIQGEMLVPVTAHGLQCMSMSFLASDRTPAVWRGPMAAGALQQLLTQTIWQDIEYLVVDMPPGTGDIQLTLAQRVPIDGAIVVTTPQDIALLDARKGIEMFRRVEVPVLGIVENMSTHICSSCGHEEAIFGTDGGEKIAREYGTKLLTQLPLSLSVREQIDAGKPTLVAEPEADVSQMFRHLARQVVESITVSGASAGPRITVVDD